MHKLLLLIPKTRILMCSSYTDIIKGGGNEVAKASPNFGNNCNAKHNN